ncbi:hypothetical protein [Desulfosporosinus sp.]|uniref:hypothetical protein n=1 Tax=Desulfosporosinus sp. TaxID=157907 RepID=UPI0025BF193D|nr:hypothetical protein [Desulfosporosinus sp.]MBC2721811.1 hypothetical protein [Desulfosporosinus sp.]MBC2726284.1 hypothetical protein [Desulfosporosinus sp.]
MLRKIIETKTGPLTAAQFAEVMDLATTDIQINRLNFGKRTSLSEAVEIAAGCFIAMSRGAVA